MIKDSVTKEGFDEDSQVIKSSKQHGGIVDHLHSYLRGNIFGILGFSFIITFVILYFDGYSATDYLKRFLQENRQTILLLLIFLLGCFLLILHFLKDLGDRGPLFVDVDERSRQDRIRRDDFAFREDFNHLLSEISKSKDMNSLEKKEVNGDETRGGSSVAKNSEFVAYFNSIRILLEEKASVADEKASILLDKGTGYSRLGIVLFIFSIIGWQVFAHYAGFKVQIIYGVVSTSLLFVFIEFLSAWFLKQYRQFIDTSTYLIKVKSIFDRYMLVYLANKEAMANGNDENSSNQMLLEFLRADIAWPDTYLIKNPDLSFAKEALETMTVLVRSMKNDVKEEKSYESVSASRKRTI